MHLLVGQKRLKDEYKDPSMLLKVNKANMAGMMEAIKENLRSHCFVIMAPLAYIIRKAITVKIYGVITRMLHLPPDKNRQHNEQSAQWFKDHIAEYEIDNRSVYDILDQIY